MLKDKRRKRELSLDTMLEKQQSKAQQITGPLAEVWFRIEEAIVDPSSQLDIQELIGYVEQTVLMTGQACNAIPNVLTAAGTETSRAKSSLKDQSKLIQPQSEELFRKAFRKHIRDTAKARKESKEVYNKPQQRSSDDYVTNRNNRQPFLKSSSFSKQNGGRSGGYASRNNNNN